VYPMKAELMASFSAFVIHIPVIRWHETGEYNILARLSIPNFIRKFGRGDVGENPSRIE
jgi:hypothetical protein